MKNNLLTIGEVAKLTCLSVDSLRYYEKINIMKPAHIDADSGYRYYAFEQLFHIQIITFCVELDIPLKELTEFINDDETLDYLALLAYGKKIGTKKLQKIQKGLNFVERAEQQILANAQLPQLDIIYSKSLSEKYFHVMPYDDKPFGGENQFTEVAKAFLRFETVDDDDYADFLESGLLYEKTPTGIKRYIYIELAQPIEDEHVKTIPAGTYHCMQNHEITIESTAQIFNDFLKDSDSFLAIETVFFSKNYDFDNPISELRVIGQNV